MHASKLYLAESLFIIMKLLFLCGVDQAGKSTTIRHSLKFLNVNEEKKHKFLNNPTNTPKTIMVDGKVVCVFLDSPQEATSSPEEAVEYLRKKITFAKKKEAELLVMALNIAEEHNLKVDACLDEIESLGFKPRCTFIYLDSQRVEDVFARHKLQEFQARGFIVTATVIRSSPDQQGEMFATHIMRLM